MPPRVLSIEAVGEVEAAPGGEFEKGAIVATLTGGFVCMTGMVGDKCSLEDFNPTAVCLTTYDGGVADFIAMPMREQLAQVADGSLRAHVGRTFHLDEIVETHRCMEENRAGGKIVLLAP